MPDVLLSERPTPKVRLLTLNRPDRLNAITSELCAALHGELEAIAADRACRAVVLTGAGRGFCAGLDLHGYGDTPGNDGSDQARDRLGNQEHMSRLILRLRDTPQPIMRGMWTALELPSERAAAEYEDRQQIMATHGAAPPEAITAFLEKRPADLAD